MASGHREAVGYRQAWGETRHGPLGGASGRVEGGVGRAAGAGAG